MSSQRLVVPALLAVATAALAGCAPRCPDPSACYSELVPGPDGGVAVQYRRADGGLSSVPCPAVPEGCPVA